MTTILYYRNSFGCHNLRSKSIELLFNIISNHSIGLLSFRLSNSNILQLTFMIFMIKKKRNITNRQPQEKKRERFLLLNGKVQHQKEFHQKYNIKRVIVEEAFFYANVTQLYSEAVYLYDSVVFFNIICELILYNIFLFIYKMNNCFTNNYIK